MIKLKTMKKLYCLFALLICITQINAQGFYSMARFIDSAYANDVSEDGPKNNIERMRKRWDGQFDQNGSFTTAAQKLYSFTQNLTNARIANGSCQNFDPTWKEIGPTMKVNNSNGLVGAGQINNLTFHPQYDGINNQIIYATSFYGGIWKTTDDGESWIRLNTDKYIPFSSIGELLIDPTNPNRMYATTGKYTGSSGFMPLESIRDYPLYTIGIYASDDAGVTWEKINTGIDPALFTGGIIYNIEIDPLNNNHLIFTSTEGVFVSTNATTGLLSDIYWTKDAAFSILSNNDDQLMGLTYNPSSHEWFVSGLNIYSNTNPFIGNSWTNTTGSGSGLDLTGGIYQPTSEQIVGINVINSLLTGKTNDIYALVFVGSDNSVVVKKTGGANWQIIKYLNTPMRHRDKMAMVASSIGVDDFYIGNSYYYFIDGSTNNVSTAYPNNYHLHSDIHAIFIHPLQPNRMWLCSDGGLTLKLLNSGAFDQGASYKNNGIQSQLLWQFDDSEMDKDYLLGALQDNGCQFIGGFAANNWKQILTDYSNPATFGGDGYNASIIDNNPQDALERTYGGTQIPPYYFNYTTGATSPFPNNKWLERMEYFSDPEHPNERVYIGDWQWKVSQNNQTNWAARNDYSISNLIINYKPASFPSSRRPEPFKFAFPKYSGSPLTVYAITMAEPYNVSANNTLPSLIFKSTNGFNSQPSDPNKNYFTNINSITNALYDKARAVNAIYPSDSPILSSITCKPEDGNKVWVCSNGLLPNFKIWNSTDGGITWQNADINHIFVNIPVFDLVAVEGSKDIVFAATMDGVYYTDNTMAGNWCRYGESPSVQVLRLKVNYCKNALIVSTYGRGAFEVSLPSQAVPSTDITVNTTWTTPQDFPNTTLTVKSGKTLTINNTICTFGPNSRLVVEKNAKLIVNNSTLTSASTCNGYLWGGIEVQGDINFRQQFVGGLDPNHGYAILQNNAIVQNAHYAIQNHVSVNGDIDWSKLGGGIVRCSNTQFINCQKGANFFPYTNHNLSGASINELSSFNSCQFITDATTAAHNFMPEAHASFWNTKGVNLISNTFKNITPNSYAIDARGNGIVSYDASYDVVRSCNIIDAITGACAGPPNVFENLYYAIDASASLPTASLRVDNNVFTNNHRGVVLHGVEFAQIMNNTIDVGDGYIQTFLPSTAISFHAASGIFLDGCDAYIVENNTLNDATTSGSPLYLKFGIVDSYSNTNPNELRQNNFTNLGVGIQAQENNDGLQLKCNQFANASINTADVKVIGLATQGSIAQQQGYCSSVPTTLPGNEFSHTCAAGAQDLAGNNVAYQVTYNTRLTVSAETPPVGCYNSTDYFVNPCSGVGSGAVCPPSNFTPSALKIAIKNSKQDIKSLQQLLSAGDAPALYTAITNGNDANVKTKLLNKSPYLSDNVLLAFLNHIPSFSETTIKAVLLANSPLSSIVYNSLFKLKLTDVTLSAIKNAQAGISQRTYTERGLAYEKSQLVINYNKQLSYVLNNRDNEARFDSLVKKFDFAISPKSRSLYASSLIDQKKYPEAQVQLDSLQTTMPQLKDYLQQVMQLRQSVNQIQAYSGILKQNMDNLKATRPNDLAIKAQALYNSLFKKTFGEEIYITKAQQASVARMQQEVKEKIQSEDVIKVYPNPANNELYFVFNTDVATDITVNLYNVTGQLVKTKSFKTDDEPKLLELHELDDGIYFYQILSANSLLKANKVIIIK